MQRAATLATAFSLLALAALPAQAELGASGTRLSVAGSTPRFYMTYGHLDEREFFAPILTELKRLQVTFIIEGDSCKVLHKGSEVATWPVIRSRDDIPASLDKPFILMLGSTTFVPVKRLARVLPIDASWDRRSNTVTVVEGRAKPPVTAARPKPKPAPRVAARPKPTPAPPVVATGPKPTPTPPVSPEAAGDPALQEVDPAATGSIELSGVTVERVGASLRVRVQATAPVRPTALYLKAPTRIALDFADARWQHGLQAPAGLGGVRSLRIGHPAPGQARLVLEATSPTLKLSKVEVSGGEVLLSLGAGAQVAKAAPTKLGGALAAKVRAAVARRSGPAMVRLTRSRGVIRVSPTFARASQGGVPGSNAWQYIVIHHSATPSGNATTFDAVHRRKAWDGLAYHFVINNGKGNPDGHLEVSSRWGAQKHGAHAGGLPGFAPADVRNGFNEFGIGICLVGNFQNSKPSAKQLQTLALLIQELRAEFDIPLANVLGHAHVKGTACPGNAFPWKKLFALMEAPTPARHKHAPVRTTARCPWCLVQEAEK